MEHATRHIHRRAVPRDIPEGLILASLSIARGTEECSNTVKLNENENYMISTLDGPRKCYWNVVVPKDTFVTTKCNYSMPKSKDCNLDQIRYVHGPMKMVKVCGKGEINIISLERKFGLGIDILEESKVEYSCTISTSWPENPSNCACGWYPPELSNTGMRYYPFLAALTSNGKIFAAATIISRNYALTTATAIEQSKKQNGLIQLAVRGQRKHTVVYHSITTNVHDKYNGLNNDIALIRTDVPIEFSSYVGPICLPFKYTSQSEHITDTATLLGFVSDDMEFSQVLATNLTVLRRNDCEATLQDRLSYDFKCMLMNRKDMGCAYNEGSPFVWRWNESRHSYYLLYLESLMNPCKTNSVNTKITEHVNWIVENTKDNFLCRDG